MRPPMSSAFGGCPPSSRPWNSIDRAAVFLVAVRRAAGCDPRRPAPKVPRRTVRSGLLQIGCTIAVHTGPYALGMGVMRRWKKQGS